MRRILIMWTLAFSLALSSCGGAAAPTTKINVTLTDFQFTPNQFTVPAGQQIDVDATNSGAVVHNFVIMKLGQTAGTEFTDGDLPNVYWKVEVAPGGSANTSFVAPTQAGDYEVVCSTPGHVQAGMVAKLKVVENK